jgi:two-component system, NtrC family, sensor histidine kinase HydH
MTLRWYRDRHVVALVGMVAAASLLVTAFVLGLVSFLKMRQLVTREFNAQQLVLARNLAALIGQDIDVLRRELLLLNHSLAAGGSPEDRRASMNVALASIAGAEVLEVRYLDARAGGGRVVAATGDHQPDDVTYTSAPFFQWALRAENRGRVLVTPSRHWLDARRAALTLLMVTPHTDRAGATDGVLAFVVDATALARRFTAAARSGATGYAWVLDERGTFLAHPMEDFIGKNAFTARHEKDPHLGFEGINAIMRDFMLRGQEGMGEYESGWHRQAIGPVRKLIAYSPIVIDAHRPPLVWSAAVVAPVSEVQAMVRALLLRQLAVQLAIVLAIAAGGFSLLRMERYWAAVKREKERELNLSSRLAALGTLAAGVAHEVNNPIAIIMGFTDLLLERTPPGTEEHDQLRIIERQADVCKTIVENLGNFARVHQPRSGEVDVNAELQRVLAIVRNTLLTETIRCVVVLEDALPPARGDGQGLQQVLLNLITNARAAMKAGGTLGLRTRRVGDWIEIEVSDTGHGIARQDLERIFDPFFTTKAPGEGTGLGLSISHGIVREAGGTIAVESRDVQEAGPERCGTTFRVRFPVAHHGVRPGDSTSASTPTGGCP